jgi:hypothetical protein
MLFVQCFLEEVSEVYVLDALIVVAVKEIGNEIKEGK